MFFLKRDWLAQEQDAGPLDAGVTSPANCALLHASNAHTPLCMSTLIGRGAVVAEDEHSAPPHLLLDACCGSCGPNPRMAFLVDDKDLARLTRFAERQFPESQIIVYTLSGTGEHGFCKSEGAHAPAPVAILPPRIARALLEELQARGDEERLPTLSRFLVLAYQVAYLGGTAATLRLRGAAGRGRGAVDGERLRSLASLADVDCGSICRSVLDGILAEKGWRPPIDMLERLAVSEPWIRTHLLPTLLSDLEVLPGLSIFFVRKRAEELRREIREAISAEGFEILEEVLLDETTRKTLTERVRGGNWGRGPWPVSGGPPVAALVAFDVFPEDPQSAEKREHPLLDNARTLSAKLRARSQVHSRLPRYLWYNPLHSTDSAAEAWRTAHELLPAARLMSLRLEIVEQTQEIEALREGTGPVTYRSPYATGFQATLDGRPVERKIFRRKCIHKLALEADVVAAASPRFREVPRISARGTIHLDLEDTFSHARRATGIARPLSPRQVRRLHHFLNTLISSGFDLATWSPANGVRVVAGTDGMAFVGLEALARSGGPVRPGDAPGLDTSIPNSDYDRLWYPSLGIGKSMFVSGRLDHAAALQATIYPYWRLKQRLKPYLRSGVVGKARILLKRISPPW